MSFRNTWAASRKAKATTGFRSGIEEVTATSLQAKNIDYIYEAVRIQYTTIANYLPDFILPKQAIIIEDKGAFLSADRSKMLKVKQAHPHLDIRFLFFNPQTRIGKLSKTTYGAWCERHGFPYAKGGIPPHDWLTHIPTQQQMEALQRILNGTKIN